jgi:ribosomal-protein-alanine N-acetyltransferase
MTYDRDILRAASPTQQHVVAPVGPVIATASFRDLRRISALQHRAFRPPLAYGLVTLVVLWLLPNVRFLLAREGTRVVGCAIGDRQGGQSRIINICVDPDVRRRGIATRLLQELEATLPIGDVVLMVEEENEAAKALYRHEGYLPVGVSRDYYGRGKDGIWMQKHRTEHSRPKIRV